VNDGNVKVPQKAAPEKKGEIQAGDVVAMTPEALKSIKCSPRVLIESGWPNEFYVERVFDDRDHGLCLQLQECCFRRRDLKEKKKPYSCGGHPIGLFERLDSSQGEERVFEPGDARASVTIPFIGELIGYTYRAKDKKAVFRVGGQEMEAEGALAEHLNNIIKKHGVA